MVSRAEFIQKNVHTTDMGFEIFWSMLEATDEHLQIVRRVTDGKESLGGYEFCDLGFAWLRETHPELAQDLTFDPEASTCQIGSKSRLPLELILGYFYDLLNDPELLAAEAKKIGELGRSTGIISLQR